MKEKDTREILLDDDAYDRGCWMFSLRGLKRKVLCDVVV